MKSVLKRLTYANVMSSIAVFLVLGGATAFAATKIGANEIKANAITTGKIVKEAVTAGKIKNGAVTGGKLAEGSVNGGKILDGSVNSAKILDGSVNGAKILDGSVGEADLANEAVGNAKIKNGAVTSSKLAPGTLDPACPSGTTSVGGLCFETAERPAAPYASAIETCSGVGRLLPQASQLIALAQRSPLPSAEWSGDLFENAQAYTVAAAGTVAHTTVTEARAFRCVAEPTP
jgi:hypothetical protein